MFVHYCVRSTDLVCQLNNGQHASCQQKQMLLGTCVDPGGCFFAVCEPGAHYPGACACQLLVEQIPIKLLLEDFCPGAAN